MTNKLGRWELIQSRAHLCHSLQAELGVRFGSSATGFAIVTSSAGQSGLANTTSLKCAVRAMLSKAGSHIIACESPYTTISRFAFVSPSVQIFSLDSEDEAWQETLS